MIYCDLDVSMVKRRRNPRVNFKPIFDQCGWWGPGTTFRIEKDDGCWVYTQDPLGPNKVAVNYCADVSTLQLGHRYGKKAKTPITVSSPATATQDWIRIKIPDIYFEVRNAVDRRRNERAVKDYKERWEDIPMVILKLYALLVNTYPALLDGPGAKSGLEVVRRKQSQERQRWRTDDEEGRRKT